MPEYPGLGLPLRYNPHFQYGVYPMGAHGNCTGSQSDILPVREVAMMSIMDRLTDKPDWHKKVFDDAIVSKWRKEAMGIPDEEFRKMFVDRCDHSNTTKKMEGIISPTAFDYCIQELKHKAEYFEKTGLVPTLDATAKVVKSDSLVSEELKQSLRAAFDKLRHDQEGSLNWHPGSSDRVLDLVHPSMYPLVYGRSRGMKDESVGVQDAIDKWAGKGDTIPREASNVSDAQNSHGFGFGVGGSEVPPEFWSDTYQWLPANIKFEDDGRVRFTSYINNLHPNRYLDIYQTIERLIETALPAWDQCLNLATDYEEQEGAGRLVSRFDRAEDPDDENGANWDPSDAAAVAHVEVDWSKQDPHAYDPEYDDETEKKWELLRKPVIPEPLNVWTTDYSHRESARLANKFKELGLQVIVKVASIELTPDKPDFPVGGWHVEGQMNENICATALYYLDSSNITPSNLSFRMQTSAYLHHDDDGFSVGQNAFYWLEKIYGTQLGSCAPCLQTYGSVSTVEGRLLAFPNVFQHRVSPFRLVDPTKPGHRRFIALWLVDPHRRIISTANVPPQQKDWWLDSVLGSTESARAAALSKMPPEVVALLNENLAHLGNYEGEAKLPPELMAIVREHFAADTDALPMGVAEAKMHQQKLMDERSKFQSSAEDWWNRHSYSFCEH